MRTRDGIDTKKDYSTNKSWKDGHAGKDHKSRNTDNCNKLKVSRNGFAPRNSRKNTALPPP